MWFSSMLRVSLLLVILQLVFIEQSRAILTEPNVPPRRSRSERLYRYMKGYYENAKGSGSKGASFSRPSSGYVRNSDERIQSLNNPNKPQGNAHLQPKSGTQSGRYRIGQSPGYLQKLKRLAVLLKARAAARARQRQGAAQTPRGYPQPQPQPQPQPRPSYQPQTQQIPAQQGYPQPQRAPAQPAPQRTYRQPQPQPQTPPQPTYRPAQPAQQQPQPQYAQPQPQPQQKYATPQPAPPQVVYRAVPSVPASAPSPMSYQSLGLPPQSPNYRIVQQPALPTPATTPKPAPKINNEALMKLLKASYASLLPLLLNQAKMTSYGVQTIPLYGSNPYRVFGPMTYGPLPKPSLSQMNLQYNRQSFPSTQSHPFSNTGFSGYGNNNNNNNNNNTPQQQQPGYGGGSSGGSYGGSSPGSSYGSQSSGYGNVQSVQSYDVSPDVTCGPISEMFCQGRTSGLYSHPASQHCFVQCDHVGRGHARSCSPGTSWKQMGPEPALYNYCS